MNKPAMLAPKAPYIGRPLADRTAIVVRIMANRPMVPAQHKPLALALLRAAGANVQA